MIDIAIVDDDLSVRKGLSRFLRSEGYSTATFASAEEFLTSSHRHDARCLLIDVHLGAMSGFDLADRLKQAGDHRPALFMTAHETVGANCLRKPFDGEALLEWLRQTAPRDGGPAQ